MPSDPLWTSDALVRVYEACVDELLVNLARHFNVKATGNTAGFVYEVDMLSRMGAIRRETAAIIAGHVAQNEPMIALAVKSAMLDALDQVEPELAQAAREGLLNDAPMEVDEAVQARLQAFAAQAADRLNLVNAGMQEAVLSTFRAGVSSAVEVLNAEAGKAITGVSTLQKAVRSAVAAMDANGIQGFTDVRGRRWSVEAYARTVIKTTCSNAANQAVTARNADYGNDLIWVRTNATARPGCYPWQGKVISMDNRARDVTDGNGKTVHAYAANETTYGKPDGIFGINCHHGPMNVFVPGLSYVRGMDAKPQKTENDRLYALTQEQRRLERAVRYAKRRAAMYDAAGDEEAFEQAASKVRGANARLNNFVKSHDSLVLANDRTWVSGYNRRVSSKANFAAKHAEQGAAIRSDLRQAGIRGTIHTTVTPIDVSTLSFDDEHVNVHRNHGVSVADARGYIEKSKLSLTVWGGKFERYYSDEGAAYVDIANHRIRTAFSKDEYSGDAKTIMEVLKKHGR